MGKSTIIAFPWRGQSVSCSTNTLATTLLLFSLPQLFICCCCQSPRYCYPAADVRVCGTLDKNRFAYKMLYSDDHNAATGENRGLSCLASAGIGFALCASVSICQSTLHTIWSYGYLVWAVIWAAAAGQSPIRANGFRSLVLFCIFPRFNACGVISLI